ncbi:hypothetical protein B6D87_13415 [Pseudomonas fragi]|uniref:hypothetical protein n=1 Tax=Pseudomonas fragi TaxID=296 RepID=UPI000A29F67B|nr:hypothetical protein [Pseudomonas fragi]ARQ75156.1 hypothetical protein B6D87_13415 [Pseudomonas fragi]
MLDRTKTERACVGTTEFEWLGLSNIERRLIDMYRLLTEEDRKQLRRLTEALATTPEDPAVC